MAKIKSNNGAISIYILYTFSEINLNYARGLILTIL